jgi:phosphate-selective porin
MRAAPDSPRWRRLAALVALAAAALPAAVSAHLFWPTFHSAKSAISIDTEKGLQAAVVIEVPTFELLARFKEHYASLDLLKEIEAGRFDELEAKFRDIQFEGFTKGLALEIDGKAAAGTWRPVETPINGKGTEGFFVYMLEFAFTTPPQLGKRVAVRLENKTMPEAQVVMANVAEASGGWRVVESSIPPPEKYPDLPEGAQYADDIALWSIDPVKRDLRVTFERD